jgi:hypothetical protein
MRYLAPTARARRTRRLTRLLPALILIVVMLPEAAGPPPAQAADPTFAFPVTLRNSQGAATSIAIGDLDGQNGPDIVVGNFIDFNTLTPVSSQVYLNSGSGDFSAVTPVTLPQSGRFTAAVAIGDVDGVNGPDIVLANLYNPSNPATPQNSQVYLNPGNGNFAAVTPATLLAGSLATSVAIGDLSGDGRADIVLGKAAGPSLVYISPSNGNFATVIPTIIAGSGLGTYSVALGDFDGANGLDMVLGNFLDPINGDPQLSQVVLNPGGGNFAAATPTTLAASGPNTYSVAVGDLDGDDRPDIVLGNTNQPGQVYLNPGSGNFAAVAPAPIEGSGSNTLSVKLGDLNGDGALDLFSANNIQNAQVFLNNGRGVFAAPGEIPASFNGAQGAALGDLNRDGLPDAVLANVGNPSQVFLNTRVSASTAPSFGFPNQLPGTGRSTYGVAPGDLNGDGALDLVIGNNGQRSQVLLNRNDGTGAFAQPVDLDPSGAARKTFSSAVGDLNGDGALDIVLANSGESVSGQFIPQPSQIFLNDGHGAFGAPHELPGSGRPTRSIALADLNGDGALDIVLANNVDPSNPQNTYLSQVYLNPGDGDFSAVAPTDLPQSGRTTLSVVAADLNGDQKPDIVLGNYFVQNGIVILAYFSQVYLNPGNGDFSGVTPADLPGSGRLTSSVTVGDLNGDGAFDLILANYGKPSQVYLNRNNGAGTFQPPSDLPESGSYSQVVAVGDLNNDGRLDLVLTNTFGQPSQLYLNMGGGRYGAPIALPGSGNETIRMALADLNGDGLLDIILGNNGQPSQVYMNSSAISFGAPASLSGSGNNSFSATLGDFDADGALDIVLGNRGQPSQVYLNKNDGSGAFDPPANLAGSTAVISTTGVAVGDLDGDDALDIVLGNFNAASQVYLNKNDGSGAFDLPADLPASGTRTQAVALGDLNGDGALDAVLARPAQSSLLYQNKNDGSGTFQPPTPLPGSGRVTLSLALADLNGDSMTDIVLGNNDAASQVYLNDGTGVFTAPTDLPDGERLTNAVALGDLNGDGALDIVLGNAGRSSQVYLNKNDGTGAFASPLNIAGTGNIASRIALGDLNGDGAPDLVIGNFRNQRSKVYLNRNDGSGNFGPPADILGSGDSTLGLALGDLDGDGALDIVLGNGLGVGKANGPLSQVYLNHSARAARLPDNPPTIALARPGPTANANFLSTPAILDTQVISITYRVADPDGDPIAGVRAWFSLDGGNNWRPAVAATGALTTELSTTGAGPNCSSAGCAYIFPWDTFASKFFGQSDNVVFRIQAYPSVRPRPGGVAGVYQRPFASATTYPFRVRGLQVHVLGQGSQPAVGAQIYRLPAGRPGGALPIPNISGRPLTAPFFTNLQGNLRGRGEVGPGDRLLALAPISATETYTLYYTNGTPTLTGADTFTVTDPGVQTIQVSPEHPLILFNLNVSLEWDASNSPSYLQQLEFNLQRTSQYLYDFSNGQIALGSITVHQNADDWAFSDVVVHATNRLRPFAAQGGIVLTPTIDPQHADIVYDTGQVHMGAIWNRYGTPGQNLGDDWPIILAHELSHYLLYQEDSYLGLDADGLLTAIDTCTGSAMGDLYSDSSASEFVADRAHWDAACADTLGNQTLHRDEWDTIKLWYPALISPPVTLAGPSTMPFEFTSVNVQGPITPTLALADPTFYLDYVDRAVSSNEARAFLERDDQYIFDLGSPVGGQNRLLAYGAQPGDRLCVFDRPLQQYGCEVVAFGDDRIALERDTTWTPVIQLTPVTSRTFDLAVEGLPAGLPLRARLFPEFDSGGAAITLTATGDSYRGTFTLAEPSLDGNVQLWVDELATEANPRRETVVAYTIGGNPGRSRGGGGRSRGGGGRSRGGGGRSRGGGGRSRGGGAPLVSPDGQMIFSTPNPIIFQEGQFYTIQGMAALPPLPSGKIVIGQGYNLVATAGTPVITGSVSFQYLGNDVLIAGTDENSLTIHFWDGQIWKALPTVRDTYFNLASARSQGPGVYAFMAGATIPHIISISPPAATNETTRTLTIHGSGFLPPAQVKLIGPTNTYTLPVTAVFSTSITAVITAGLEAREYQVMVVNGDGGVSPTPGVFALYSPSVARFYDFFESGASKWQLDGSWGIVILPDGNRAMTDSPAGNYDSAIPPAGKRVTHITSQPFSLDGLAEPMLTFRHDYVLAHVGASQDIGRVEISTDGGATWTPLASYSGGGVYSSGMRRQDVSSPEWPAAQWKPVSISLSGYTGTVRLRFSLEVDQHVSDKGWLIDDVMVRSGSATTSVFLPLVGR